jgi:hypothetical protein
MSRRQSPPIVVPFWTVPDVGRNRLTGPLSVRWSIRSETCRSLPLLAQRGSSVPSAVARRNSEPGAPFQFGVRTVARGRLSPVSLGSWGVGRRRGLDASVVRVRRRAILLMLAGGVVEFALLALWQRNGYWEFSDGVYAETARGLLHGERLYRDVAAAQPPPVYLLGAVLLAIHDGLEPIRAGLAAIQLITAGLVATCAWRMSGRSSLALAAGVVSPLLPITLHEHAQLIPETLAAPLILAGVLACSRRDSAFRGGVLLAFAAACKLAFVFPALAITLASVARRRALMGLVLAGIGVLAATLAVFGSEAWDQTIRAQLQVGGGSLHQVAGLVAQAGWNELPLVIGAGGALLLADEALDRQLLWTLAAAAAAGLALTLTLLKRGSYIDVLIVAEPPSLALAVCGAAWAWERARTRPLVLFLTALLAAQSLSLLLSPADPLIARRPLASSGLQYEMSPAAVTHAVDRARRCSHSAAYSGVPFIAFLANRRMPGDQPDLFMIDHAPIDARFARRAASDNPQCPS